MRSRNKNIEYVYSSVTRKIKDQEMVFSGFRQYGENYCNEITDRKHCLENIGNHNTNVVFSRRVMDKATDVVGQNKPEFVFQTLELIEQKM
jgi:hypothetical protein